MSLPPPSPGPRQLSIESLALQKLVDTLQRRGLPSITNGVDSLSLERPHVRIIIRGQGDDFCGWPGCASLFRIENKYDKERAMAVHDSNHLDMTPRTISVYIPYPVKMSDRSRICAAIQVAIEQGRLAKLNVPSNTSLAVSFWEHTIPCRFCSDISVLDAPPQLTPLCEHPRVVRVITQPPPPSTQVVNIPSPAPAPTIIEESRDYHPPERYEVHHRSTSMRTIQVPDFEVHERRFDFDIANQVWEQLKHAHYHGDTHRVHLKRDTLRRLL